MRLVKILLLALVASLTALSAAWAQQEIIREIQRKANAKEKDNGYCAGIAAGLERLTDAQLQTRTKELLSRADAHRATLLFATDGPAAAAICFYFEISPAAMREGKKCRVSTVFECSGGGDCSTNAGPICEKSPGVWE